MNNVLLWVGGLLVAVLCALFAGPHFVDWTSYRGVLEEEASRVLGRELRVAGAVNLRLLPTPYVRFEKVRLSDAAGQTGEPFFRADDFTLWLAPGPLLRGAIEAREIELSRPTLKLRLNAQGGGNWQTLSIARGAMPFVPSNVALQSVRITDGTVSVDGADGRERLRIGGIKGELSAATIDGPFRFAGSFDQGGGRHDVKATTTAFDPDGSLRLKGQVTTNVNGIGYTLDGRLADLLGKPQFDGQLTGQLAIVPSSITASAPQAASTAVGRVPVELRAVVAADTFGAKLTDIALAFEQDGKPQLIAGSAEIDWQGAVDLRSAFTARWIDLDHLLAGQDRARPQDTLRALAAALPQLLPPGARGRSTLAIDQVTLGAETLGDLRVEVERDDAALRLTEFRISLPGGSRANMSGSLPAGDAFDGTINLRGANLSRLLAWLGLGASVAEARTEGAFALHSKFAFDKQSLALRDAAANLGNAVLTGGIAYKWADRPRLDVVLDGDLIDLALVSPRALDLLTQVRQLTGGVPAVPPSNPSAGGRASGPVSAALAIDPQAQDASLRIRAGRLLDAHRDLRDVDVDATVINGRLDLKRLRFLSGSGFELDAEGEIVDIATRPRGSLRGTVGVGDEAAVSQLVQLFEQPADGAVFKRLRPLAPARVGWQAKFGDLKEPGGTTTPVPAEFWLDGAVLGRRLSAVARLDSGWRDWRQSNAQFNATIERPDWQRLRALLAIDAVSAPAAALKPARQSPADARGRLQIKASGRPDQSLSTYLKIEDEAFDAGVSGRVTVGADAVTAADGELQLRTSDVAQALAALGLKSGNLPGIAIEGAADLAFKDDLLRISPSALEVGGAVVGGEVTITRAKDRARQRIEGRLTASQVRIPRLLDLLVDGGGQAPREAVPQLWPTAAFDFGMLDHIEGRLRIEAADLTLGDDLGLTRGVIEAEFAPGKLDVKALEGELLGGRLSSNWRLDKATAGANLSGNLKVGGARLDLLAPPQGRIGGTAAVTATVTGRGLSPRGLLAALAGKGEIEVTKAEFGSLAPLLLRRLSDEVVNGKREATIEVIEQGVLSMLNNASSEARLMVGNRKFPFEVADGAVKVAAFNVDTPDGRAANRTTIDLAGLRIDSEWKIEQRTDPSTPKSALAKTAKSPTALPPVTVVFVGPAAALGALDPVISVDALVRELTVRRMERDVEELERLRQLDEERAKAAVERRAADDAARAAAAAAAATAASVAPWVPSVGPPSMTPALPAPAGADATAPAPVVVEPQLSPEPKRRAQNGVGSEPRQVPSSQQLKNSRIQDIFRKQESGGN